MGFAHNESASHSNYVSDPDLLQENEHVTIDEKNIYDGIFFLWIHFFFHKGQNHHFEKIDEKNP